MLSLRVNALLHSGQNASFFPVCFLACRAAWPDVVKKSLHPYCFAIGHGYWFFLGCDFEFEVAETVETRDGSDAGELDAR